MSEYAEIYLLDAPFCIDKAYDYYIPPNLRRDIICGDFVTVPFGTSNNRKLGLVAALKDTPCDSGIEHKSILEITDGDFSLSDEQLKLCMFLKEHTICTVGDAAKAVCPVSLFSKTQVVYTARSELSPDGKAEGAPEIYAYINAHKNATLGELRSIFGSRTDTVLRALLRDGYIEKQLSITRVAERFEEYVSLVVSDERARKICDGEDSVRLRSAKHRQILEYLICGGECEKKRLMSDCSATSAQLKALCERGLVSMRKQSCDRSLGLIKYPVEKKELVLSDEQNAAYQKLCELCESDTGHGVLLHGVTGSGKTSVMLKTIDRVLSLGRSAIVMLPEIALTPQSLKIFCSRYGERVAIIHSGLSAGERFDTYKRIKSGDADVIIGTRSAVFAPVSNLGVIIIDEEQEHTYKSDMNPKYHARDIARFRAAYHNCVMLLASATPSFESYKKALDGKYTLIELKERYGGATLPSAVIADMREETKIGNTSPLGNELCRRLIDTVTRGEQAILFLNRRGYNTFISCRDCGETVKCPSCSVSMTYHTSKKSYESGYLCCHWCGKKIPTPTVCPSCGKEHLARMGYGTQKVEQELGALLPNAEILRMDTDTTSEKNAYETLLGKFKNHGADVLLGTQMVTKGHDFPDVTLVGVLLADASLYLDDYRAAERTFAMLTQVIGRAGRAQKAGVAVIQTNNPDSECIKFACKQNFAAFYESEIKLRKLLVFPPFCDIALLTLTCPFENELMRAGTLLSDKLGELVHGEYGDLPLIAYGPFEAPVYKVENKYRLRMVLKCSNNKRTRAMLAELLSYFSSSGARGLSLSIDINPTNL